MRRLSPFVLAALILSGAAQAESVAPPITRFLPPETHMAFWVDDLSEAQDRAGKNPAVQFALDEEYGVGKGPDSVTRALSRIPVSNIDPLSSAWSILIPASDVGIRSGIEAATSVFRFEIQDVTDSFSDGVAVYSTLYNLYEADGIEIVEWDSIIAAEYAEEKKDLAQRFLDKALANVPADAKRSSTEYFGLPVMRLEYFLENEASLPGDKNSDLGLVEEIPVIVEYAWTPTHLLLAEGRGKPLERSLRAFTDNDPRFSLTGQSGFRQASSALGSDRGQFHFYMDLAHHVREWQDFPSQKEAVRMAAALGFRNAGPLIVDGRFEADSLCIAGALALPPEPEGMFDMLATSPHNELDGLKLVPGDSESFGTLSLDMLGLYRQVRAAQQVLQPNQRAATDAVVKSLEAMAGVQIERDLLQDAKGEMVTYMRLTGQRADGSPEFASGVVFPLRGTGDTVRIVNQLLDKLSDPTIGFLDLVSTDFQGLRLWETPEETITAAGVPGFHFTQTINGFLSTTSGAEVRDLARRVLGENSSPSMAEQPLADVIRTKLPSEGLRGFHFTRSGAVIEDLTRMSRRVEGVPSAERLREVIGDTYWSLQVRDNDAILRLVLESPAAKP